MAISLTPSHIIEYLYCPRFTYFEYVLRIPQYEEKYFKVNRGRAIHEKKARENTDYLRRRIGVKDKRINQYLTNELLRGEIDEVLFLEDGSCAPLDYKYAEYKGRVFDTYKTQLYCYAWLIESNYSKKVNRGYLVYTRSQNRLVEVAIDQKHLDKIHQKADQIIRIISQNYYPKATPYKKRCMGCTYRNICTR